MIKGLRKKATNKKILTGPQQKTLSAPCQENHCADASCDDN
jgi:hypothetical protein